MQRYRDTIYSQYHSNQVNKNNVNHAQLLEQQSYYYGKEISPYLPKNKAARIVDLGCGFGSMIHAAMSKSYTNIEGIDLSEEQVKVAHELGITQVNRSSINEFIAEEGEYDCIVGIDIIEHFTKDELIDFLKGCIKKLKPGGTVVFRTPNMDAEMASVYAFADISHETFFNKSSAKQLLNSVGFLQVEVHPSMILNRSVIKETVRKVLWKCSVLRQKIKLFASGRTWGDVVFTPNIIITAVRP